METMLKERGIDRGKELKPGDIASVQQMFSGLRMAIQVEPAGRIVRSNSPYVEGGIVTLFDLNLDELLKNEAALTRLQAAATPGDVTAVLKDLPGLKMVLDDDISIEFTPAR
jgi:hypothetical protein